MTGVGLGKGTFAQVPNALDGRINAPQLECTANHLSTLNSNS